MSHYKCVTAICNLCALADPEEAARKHIHLWINVFSISGIFGNNEGLMHARLTGNPESTTGAGLMDDVLGLKD